MHLSFSKMNPGTTVQFAASRGPQNEVHPSLRCPWEPATPQCEDNHHLTQWGKAQLFVCLCTVLILAPSVPAAGFFFSSLHLAYFLLL